MRLVSSKYYNQLQLQYVALSSLRKAPNAFYEANESVGFKRVLDTARQESTGIIWNGSYEQGVEMYKRLALTQKANPPRLKNNNNSPLAIFEQYREHQRKASAVRHSLLVSVDCQSLRIKVPCDETVQTHLTLCLQQVLPVTTTSPVSTSNNDTLLISFRDLQEVQSAYALRQRGVRVPVLGENAIIHPHFGVFWPARQEYVRLVSQAPLSPNLLRGPAIDCGTGTGVLALVLANRGMKRVVATDIEPRAIACAQDQISRFNKQDVIHLVQADVFPSRFSTNEKFTLAVCNPPWLPGEASSSSERGVFDSTESSMLNKYLENLSKHLDKEGVGWLIMSDFAEILGLRKPNELEDAFQKFNLKVQHKLDAKPDHAKISRTKDNPMTKLRARETVSLYVLSLGNYCC